jgi:formylglycine-generating enzyme required for sulfatase activity
MTRLILSCFSIFHLFSAQAQKIIKPITPPSVKQEKKEIKTNKKPKIRKAPTQTPAFAELELVLVHGQLFTMGDVFTKEMKEQKPPIHNEKVEDFYIARYEVSQWLWTTGMDKNPAFHFRHQNPVENVSWEDVQVFISKLNALTGRKFRLPTETEWEFAAREEGKKKLYGNGKNQADPLKMNFKGIDTIPIKQTTIKNVNAPKYDIFNEQNSNNTQSNSTVQLPTEMSFNTGFSSNIKGVYRQETTLKASFSPNKLGLYDMAGNVAEWCSNCGTKEELQIGNGKNETKFVCIVRGGCWYSTSDKCTTFYRSFAVPELKDKGIGFRLAEDVD